MTEKDHYKYGMESAHEKTRIRQLEDAAAHWEHKYTNARQYNRNLEDRIRALEADLARCRSAITHDTQATRRIADLQAAVRWALGEGYEDFPFRQSGEGVYWWRTELRRRSGLALETFVEPPGTNPVCKHCGQLGCQCGKAGPRETGAEQASYLKTRDCEHEWIADAHNWERCSKCRAGRITETKGEQG